MSRGSSFADLSMVANTTMADREVSRYPPVSSRPSSSAGFRSSNTDVSGKHLSNMELSNRDLSKREMGSKTSVNSMTKQDLPRRVLPKSGGQEILKKFTPKPIQITSAPRIPVTKTPSVFNTDWMILTAAYSSVMVAILLIGNVTPEGRLYIYFTALWSTLFYFLTENDGANMSKDIIDSVAEGLVPKSST